MAAGAIRRRPPGAAAPAPFEIEVIVRTGETFTQAAQVHAFVAAAAAHRVQAINLLVKQDEDGALPSGSVFYASRIAPVAAGYAQFDVLQTMLDTARPLGVKVHAWMPQFHDQVAARAHPEWQMLALKNGQLQPYTGSRHTEYFVNPLLPAVQADQRSLIDEVLTRYPVDGVMLDWIRFDDFNMDMGAATRQADMASTVAKAGAAAVVPAMDSSLAEADYAQTLARLHADFPGVRRLSWFHHGRWNDERLARIERLSGH